MFRGVSANDGQVGTEALEKGKQRGRRSHQDSGGRGRTSACWVLMCNSYGCVFIDQEGKQSEKDGGQEGDAAFFKQF